LFKSDGGLRTYILNRPAKLNTLNEPMLNILRPKIEEWAHSDLTGAIAGTGVGRAFCAGGDVAEVVEQCKKPATLSQAIDFFKREFEMDYILAAMPKPYVAFMDGITMGGGVGLAVNAPFRVATENTMFAMPETKIGYCPDVGGSYFLSRVDGELGTYLGLTAEPISGRAVFEHGFATHFIPSRRIPGLLERIASLEKPTYDQIDALLEEARADQLPDAMSSTLVGDVRVALDKAFRHDSVDAIFADLQAFAEGGESAAVREWAQKTLATLELRSPTSLRVALRAVRKGKKMSLLEALQMEMNIATAFCHGSSPDFRTGVTAVLVTKSKDRPEWSPSTLSEVSEEFIQKEFFSAFSPEAGTAPKITPPEWIDSHPTSMNPMKYALPTEEEVQQMVTGSHKASGDFAVTVDDLVARFEELKKGKSGVREKVLEIVARKCKLVEDGGEEYLKWAY